MSTTERPTPETDAVEETWRNVHTDPFGPIKHARKLERERDEALEALSGRTVSCQQCNEAARQLEAVRLAIKDAGRSLADLVEHIEQCSERDLLNCDQDPHPPSVFSVYAAVAKRALAKLQPLLKS